MQSDESRNGEPRFGGRYGLEESVEDIFGDVNPLVNIADQVLGWIGPTILCGCTYLSVIMNSLKNRTTPLKSQSMIWVQS